MDTYDVNGALQGRRSKHSLTCMWQRRAGPGAQALQHRHLMSVDHIKGGTQLGNWLWNQARWKERGRRPRGPGGGGGEATVGRVRICTAGTSGCSPWTP